MKKITALLLCICVGICSFAACSETKKTVEDQMNFTIEQFGKPVGEVYKNMELSVPIEEAEDVGFYYFARDCMEFQGKTASVAIDSREESSDALKEKDTHGISYYVVVEDDVDYVLKIYQDLKKLYGESKTEKDDLSFEDATESSMKAIKEEDVYRAVWETDDWIMRLFFFGDKHMSLEIFLPAEKLDLSPIYAEDGTRLR